MKGIICVDSNLTKLVFTKLLKLPVLFSATRSTIKYISCKNIYVYFDLTLILLTGGGDSVTLANLLVSQIR